MATFTWTPDIGAACTRAPRIRSTSFGDGYEQRMQDGLNADLQTWKVTFSKRSESETAAIEAFLAGLNGTSTFSWAVPGSSYAVADHGFGVGDGSKTTFQIQATKISTVTDALGTWPVYTTPRTNLLKYSQEFDNAVWSKVNSSVTANGAAAPDGASTADKLVENTATTVQHRVDYSTAGLVAGTCVFSVYAKAAGRSQVALRIGGASGFNTKFDLAAGTVAPLDPGFTFAITPVGNGWYRISIAGACAGGDILRLNLLDGTGQNTYTGDGASGVLLWGAQVEQTSATAPTRYIPTTSAAVRQDPAFWPAVGDGFEPVTDFNGAPTIYRTDWQGKQQLYPWARTNLFTYSEQFNDASWQKIAVAITANYATAPDGTATMDLMTPTNTVTSYVQKLVTVATNSKYTLSAYLVAGNSVLSYFRVWNSSVTVEVARINISWAGGVPSISGSTGGATYAVVQVAPGIYRVSMTFNTGANTSIACTFYPDGSNGPTTCGIWGAQLEAGGTATSYIQTTSAAATVTDYTLSNGQVTLANAPLSGASLTWSGSGSRLRTFICKEWERRVDSVSATISATFRQVPA